MFRERNPQGSLFQSVFLFPEAKARRLEKSWADMFQARALPLIDENSFAGMYCEDNGRPNRAVQTILGVLLLKDMFNLTDEEALENLEFNLLWHHALRLTLEEAHLPQKTLHNFRQRLMTHDGGRIAFCEITDRILQALGIQTGRQRLDSTHIMSNIATLTRLGLFCETIRLFLRTLGRRHLELSHLIPEGLVRRYLKEEGEATSYEDARSDVGRRRLGVCARDLYRLVNKLKGTAAEELDGYRLLKRLLHEQCHVGRHSDGRPEDGDDDAGEGKVPIALKSPKEIGPDSLQSPYDAEVTYSGHKGKGYEVQVSETCDSKNPTQIITHVELTPSCESDAVVPLPLLDTLNKRNIQPGELFADTVYGSGRNAIEAEIRGTELVSPVAGPTPDKADKAESDATGKLTAADFQIDITDNKAAVCPAGYEAVQEYEEEGSPERVLLHFNREVCQACSIRSRCPVKYSSELGVYVLTADLIQVNIKQRRRLEASGEFRKRYAVRAGIEGTNSELKRAHGLGRLRVRGECRVNLAVYLKTLACNIKRMVKALLEDKFRRPCLEQEQVSMMV
jgi:Transposase DDE domain/Transposase domain (DUF772)